MTARGPCRILADDMTGALDAAAPFATPEAPVLLSAPGQPAGRLTASTETRHAPADAARAAVRAQLAGWGPAAPGTLWFKKVDSVLRGQPIVETVEMMAALGLARCLFAPAFPEMGRKTRGGRHFTTAADGSEIPAAIHDLVAAFAAAGVRAAAFGSDSAASVWIADATAPADLPRVVAAIPDRGALLWAGSRGLAAALAGARPGLDFPPVSLVIAGTSHPATRAQMRHLAAGPMAAAVLDPVPLAAGAAETRAGLRDGLRALAGQAFAGRAIIVIGGDTLSVVLEYAAPERVECIGEAGPGLPLTRLVGGALSGAVLISKSGGFGDPDLLTRLIRQGAA